MAECIPMTDSLRDQLLGLGFKPAPKPASGPNVPKKSPHSDETPAGRQRLANRANLASGKVGADNNKRPSRNHGTGGPGRHKDQKHAQGDIDLAKAYAIRAQREKDDRIAAERAKQEASRLRREAKTALAEFLKDRALNDATAEIARHFSYGGKIKRIHVNAGQLRSLNAGELGVAQLDGRYLLVTSEVLAQAEAIFPAAVALKVDPDAAASDDPYADPQYQVPDDLVW